MAENESSENKKSFQVVDKRRFDSTGHERGEASASQPATAHGEKKQSLRGIFVWKIQTPLSRRLRFHLL